VNINKESYIVTLPYKNTSFYFIIIKLYLIIEDNKDTLIPDLLYKPIKHFIIKEVLKYKRGRLYKATSFIVDYKTFL
jgi:hypothetical protein